MALKEVLAFFSFEVEGADDLAAADKQTTALTKSVQALGGVLAGIGVAAGVKGLFDFVNGAADAADATDKFATAIGTSAREVAEWDQVLGNAGVGLEKGRLGLKTFTKTSGEAAKGNKDLRATFRKLGVRAKDSSGQLRPFNDRLTDTVLGLNKIEDPARRAATAEKLFGEAGLGFVRIALDGADALEAQRQEFEDLFGSGGYEKFTEDSKKAAVANDRWRNATNALKSIIASALVPALTRVVVTIAKLTRGFAKLVSGTKIVQTSLIVLGTILAALALKVLIAFAPVILTFGLFAAAVAGAVLIIEDLYQLFTGGESLIGRWLKSYLGATKAKMLVESIREAVIDLGSGLVKTGAVIKDIFEAVLPVSIEATRVAATILVEMLKESLERVEKLVSVAKKAAEGVKFVGRKVFGSGGDSAQLTELARRSGFQVPEPAPEDTSAVRQQALVGAAVAPMVGSSSSSAVTVNSPTQITVQGSSDPEATAQRVVEVMEAREQDTLRRARDLALAR
jgi:hypothetical protein